MTAPGRPCQGRSPGWVIRQPGHSSAPEEELDHQGLAEFGGPAERRRTNILVASVNISAVVKEDRGVFHFAIPGKLVKGRDPKPGRFARIHTVSEEQLCQFTRAAS